MNEPTTRERAARTSLTLAELGEASKDRNYFEATQEQERLRLLKVEAEIEDAERVVREHERKALWGEIHKHVVFTVKKAEDARFAQLMGVRPTQECGDCTDETRTQGGCFSCGDTRIVPCEPDEIVKAGLAPLKGALAKIVSVFNDEYPRIEDLTDEVNRARRVLHGISLREE